MNRQQLLDSGVPHELITKAMDTIKVLAAKKVSNIRYVLEDCVNNPEVVLGENKEYLYGFANAVLEYKNRPVKEPATYQTWGADGIEEVAKEQMDTACEIPPAVAGALMPDAHLGYGLPIGGVLALDNAICPYAVGVDIACRMKVSVLPMQATEFDANRDRLRQALVDCTVFGVGQEQTRQHKHDVFDQDWRITDVTRKNRQKARQQLGTSGSGNHFVEWGVVTVEEKDEQLGLEPGEYVALMSHSGSRGAGAAVCKHYSKLAERLLPNHLKQYKNLAWLDMDSAEGQEYWAAMNLMGDYAAANHDVIHRRCVGYMGENPIAVVENHHNFAWKENHNGKEVYVHRKGATPAGEGVLGVIPGSMADPAYLVRGRGNVDSLDSASHGAGRKMSRRAAKEKFGYQEFVQTVALKGVELISASADELPGAYKNIDEVMSNQTDLVTRIARFDPRIVRMAE